jgi:hypothetical protein
MSLRRTLFGTGGAAAAFRAQNQGLEFGTLLADE